MTKGIEEKILDELKMMKENTKDKKILDEIDKIEKMIEINKK